MVMRKHVSHIYLYAKYCDHKADNHWISDASGYCTLLMPTKIEGGELAVTNS